MPGRILVAFGTMSGSTREVAEAIGEELRAAGRSVDVCRAPEVRDVSGYGAAVVGGPVMMGMAAGGTVRLLKRFRSRLREMPLAYFVTCGAMSDPIEENKVLAAGYLDTFVKSLPEITPVDKAVFGGALKTSGPDFDRVFFFFKWIIPKVAASMKDGRNYSEIRAWAAQLAVKL